jgi:hypothetical protein
MAACAGLNAVAPHLHVPEKGLAEGARHGGIPDELRQVRWAWYWNCPQVSRQIRQIGAWRWIGHARDGGIRRRLSQNDRSASN